MRRPRSSIAGALFRAFGLLLILSALVFNTYLISQFPPHIAPGSITGRGIWAAQKAYFASGLFLLLFAEAVHPSVIHHSLKKVFERRLMPNVLLLVLSLCVPVFILELALRPFTIDHLTDKATTIFIKDKDLGWKLRPDHRGRWGDYEVQINSKGLRGPEIPYERNHDTLRILYLGDSVTFGYNLARYDMSFPYMIESLLEHNRQIDVETVNAGVGGYSPWQYDVYLSKEGAKYEPDIVLVGFVLNDVTEKFDLVRFGGSGIGYQLNRSYFSIDDWLASKVAIYATIHRIKSRVQLGRSPKVAAIAREQVSVEELARRPDSELVKNAWAVTLKNLDRIVEHCREKNLRLAVVVFPFTFQFQDPDSLDSGQRVLASFCEDVNIPFLDLLAPLSHYLGEHNLKPEDLFIDSDHLNELGSKVVAEFIVTFLEQEDTLEDLFAY